jgi:hypothetical protein
LPGEADLDSLFAFAKAAGVKVIYCLQLHDGDPQADAATAKYIMERYAPLVDCFSIGQEPSAYPKIPVHSPATSRPAEGMGVEFEKYPYAMYRQEWKKFAEAIIGAAPGVKFCGPGVHNNGEWARRFMADFGRGDHVAMITEHLYPGGAGGKVPTPEIGRDRMLGEAFVKAYQKLYDGFAPMAISNGLPYRLEEVNNYFNGGAEAVSTTFASALWGLDFMYWWAAHNAAGVNFHTGDRVAAGAVLRPSKYTAFFSTTNGYVIRPLGYGIKAFDLGSHGRFVPAAISPSTGTDLSAYAVLGDDKALYLTLINKERGADAKEAVVSLESNAGYAKSEVIYLSAPNGDVAATNGVTLGKAEIKSDGAWAGQWSPAAMPIKLPPATAAVVKLSGH